MSWIVEWTQPAVDDMRALDRMVAHRVRSALRRLANEGHGDVKRLKGRGDLCRLRVGDWRVIFDYDFARGALRITRVARRDQVYRD